MIKELLKDPEKYRIGENYKATNIVFPVEFEGQKFIVKKARSLASLLNAYYVIQDNFFYKTRQVDTGKQGIQKEAEKSKRLGGIGVPKFVDYDKRSLVREYITGQDFRGLSSDGERRKSLDGALQAMEQIHEKDVVIGSAHAKNIFLGKDGVYWMDLGGVFDESNLTRAKAIDILTFVYSTYTASRDDDMTVYAARIASKYSDKSVKGLIKDLLTPGLSAARLWFPMRLPLDGRLNEEVKRVLRG